MFSYSGIYTVTLQAAANFFYLIFLFRYVARRPVRSRMLAVRAERIAAERSGGCTTDDDVMSELRLGKFCPKGERRQQLERQRQRRAEETVRLKNLSLEAANGGSGCWSQDQEQSSNRLASTEEGGVANAASPGRSAVGRSLSNSGSGGMTNSPSCGDFRQARPYADAATATRRQQDSGGGSVATEKRYSYHEESYSQVPNDILVSVMTV
jgi:hypothetical protein